MVGLGDLSGGSFRSVAWGVSGDGSLVVGYSESGPNTEAFIWDAHHGMRKLSDVLMNDYGLNLTGWSLTQATAITPDGASIVGWGTNPSGNIEAWIVQIPEPNPCLLVLVAGVLLCFSPFTRSRNRSPASERADLRSATGVGDGGHGGCLATSDTGD